METAVVICSKSAVTMSKSANAKMNFLRALNLLHKTKMFGKNNSEPLWKVFRKHPITRGMASYLVIWPTGNIIQQTLCEQEYDWWKVMRFAAYGSLIVAPSLFAIAKIATFMYPNTNLRFAMAKISMTWLETFSAVESWKEVKSKFPPTYFIAISIIPLIGTINFALIPESKRLFFTSCFSLLWTIYLGAIQGINLSSMVDEDSTYVFAGNITVLQKIMFMKIALTRIIANIDSNNIDV